MKHNTPPRRTAADRGITLIELTVVIVVMLMLISVIAIGSQAWKRGTDRSSCIMNLRNVQMSVRSYQNLHGYSHGDRPTAAFGTQDIARHLLERGFISDGLYGQATGQHPCPGGGTCECANPDIFPMPGELYIKCSLAVERDHQPSPGRAADW